ncbi:MAG TPA: DinB family protein, partial [Gemmataceae bacterium]|nr:DinB family protein [Gemmataceae bacterium]
MTVSDLQILFDYGYWANRTLWESIARLTPEQFTRTVDGSHGSIRTTMVHVLSAEWGWLSRCGGPIGDRLS